MRHLLHCRHRNSLNPKPLKPYSTSPTTPFFRNLHLPLCQHIQNPARSLSFLNLKTLNGLGSWASGPSQNKNRTDQGFGLEIRLRFRFYHFGFRVLGFGVYQLGKDGGFGSRTSCLEGFPGLKGLGFAVFAFGVCQGSRNLGLGQCG